MSKKIKMELGNKVTNNGAIKSSMQSRTSEVIFGSIDELKRMQLEVIAII
jgi:hypothetical protein